MEVGLREGEEHGAQLAAWSAALLCQMYVSPLEGIADAVHTAALQVSSCCECCMLQCLEELC